MVAIDDCDGDADTAEFLMPDDVLVQGMDAEYRRVIDYMATCGGFKGKLECLMSVRRTCDKEFEIVDPAWIGETEHKSHLAMLDIAYARDCLEKGIPFVPIKF